jgi:hypothetical protein
MYLPSHFREDRLDVPPDRIPATLDPDMEDCWHSLALGDALTAHRELERIRESFEAHYPPADRPVDASVYVRHESTGGLHCEVIAFFAPAAATLAREFGATPCKPPLLDALQELSGHSDAD